jgi:hypothetical protein
MKKTGWWLLLVVTLAGIGVFPTAPVAAQEADDGSIDRDAGVLDEHLYPQVPSGQVRRFLVTFMKSNTSTAVRTATVVSVTNQSLTASCYISVDWFAGASAYSAPSATTNILIPPGRTYDHCSRALPTGITTCNVQSTLTYHEGRAVIASTNSTECSKVAASARVYYTTGTTDSAVAAITDSNIVRFGLPNNGD